MRKSKQFVAMPVISLEEGQQIGTIKGLVINPDKKEVAALIIEQKGWFREQKFIPFGKVRSIGDDALTIDRSINVEKGSSLPELVKLLKEKTEIISAKLVTESGTALGYVDEFYVDLQTGAIVGLEFSGGAVRSWVRGKAFLDINYVLTVGQKIIICSNEALESVIKMDGGIQETLRGLKESTGHIFSATVQKTRELGSNLNKSLEKVRKEQKEDASGEGVLKEGIFKEETIEDKAGNIDPGFRSGGPAEACSCCHGNKKEECCTGVKEEKASPPPAEESIQANPPEASPAAGEAPREEPTGENGSPGQEPFSKETLPIEIPAQETEKNEAKENPPVK